MRQPSFAGLRPVITFVIPLLLSFTLAAQNSKEIEWSKDTISRADALGAKSTYVNMIKGSGQKNATERITIPVGKLKTILDACDAKGITEISVMVISIRQSDIAHYRKNNPGSTATDDQLKGSQILVFKVPRSAFYTGAAGAKANLSSNPLLLSLMASGLVLLDQEYADLPAGSDMLFFSIGAICPPPGSCDAD